MQRHACRLELTYLLRLAQKPMVIYVAAQQNGAYPALAHVTLLPGAGSRDAAAARWGAELSEGIAAGTGQDSGLVLVVACAESADDVPAQLRRCFTHELALEAPDEAQRLALLQVCTHVQCMLLTGAFIARSLCCGI